MCGYLIPPQVNVTRLPCRWVSPRWPGTDTGWDNGTDRHGE